MTAEHQGAGRVRAADVIAAARWLIVGIALGVLPTYVLMSERAKREAAAQAISANLAASAAASAAAASVHAAWSATPPPVCPITMPTVVSVTGNGGSGSRPTQVAPANAKNEIDEAQMMGPMLNMVQGMMGGDGVPAAGASGMPDMSQIMKNMPQP